MTKIKPKTNVEMHICLYSTTPPNKTCLRLAMDTEMKTQTSQDVLSLEELSSFGSPDDLFRALDFAECDIQHQLTQIQAAVQKVKEGGKDKDTETTESISEPAESMESMESEVGGSEPETPGASDDLNTLFPEIATVGLFYTVMTLMQVSQGQITDAKQTMARWGSFPFLEEKSAPITRLVKDLGEDNFEAVYGALKTMAEDSDETVAWAASKAFDGVQKRAYEMLNSCFVVAKSDTVKTLLHVDDSHLNNLEQWEQFDKDGVSFMRRKDVAESDSKHELQLQELIRITQGLQQKGLHQQ